MPKKYFNLKKFEKKINFGFFKAKGGVSKGEYSSLNCSSSNKDKKYNVKKNINIALKSLGIENKKLKLINQIHSKRIYEITNKNYKNHFDGDGLITRDKNLALGVLTADCAPIFIFDSKYTTICCLHAGWKGTLLNIISKCVKKLNNEKKINILVAIVGPCLGSKNFEVDKSFKHKFISKNKLYSNYFIYKNKDKDLFDLRGLINFQLKNEGVNQIYNINRNTYKSNLFFSHRRATHQNKIHTGRMINIISLID